MDYDTASVAVRAFLCGLVVAGIIWIFNRKDEA